MTKPADPFVVTLTEDQTKQLAIWACDQIQMADDARAMSQRDVDYAWRLYEQARTRQGKNLRPDAADLTSYIPSEQVDSVHARIMKAVWSDPIWTVEGFGEAAEKAPFVEEFHSYKAEEERLQSVLDRLIQMALVEPRGLLEIAEGTERRTKRVTMTAAIQTDPITGGMLLDEQANPMFRTDDRGDLMEAKTDEPGAETVVDRSERVRTGPVYRILPYRDSLIMPGHARDTREIWGYGKRFSRRYDELHAASKGKGAVYDAEAVQKLKTVTDVESNDGLERSGMDIVAQEHGQADVSLWELLVLVDLDQLFQTKGAGRAKKELRGERWYLLTVHTGTQGLLRVQHDDFERSRFVLVNLFPRADRATEGYSFVGHKLITVTEAHTAFLNMTADQNALTLNRPIKRTVGALWDPDEQPWGAGQVIDVRDPREVEVMDVPDAINGGLEFINMCERTAQRLGGINDIASGQTLAQDKTLGEVQMATEQSMVRMDLAVRRFQEAMEDIAQIRHAIWKRVLAEQPDGMDAPQSVVQNLEGRGVSIDQFLPDRKVTADLLAGAYRFKPHGSVETADPNRARNDMAGAMQSLPMLLQAFPMLAPMFQTPQASRSMGRWWLKTMRIPNPAAFLGSPSQDMEATSKAAVMAFMQRMMEIQGGMAPGMPGVAPMGGPPMPGGPMPEGAPPAPGMPPMGDPGVAA